MSAVIIPHGFSTEEDDFSSQGHLKMSGDILFGVSYHSWEGMQLSVETRDASEQPTMHRIASHDKELFVLKYH